MQRSRKDQTSFANANGSYNFGDNSANPYDTGFGFSNALLGVYNTFTQASAYINGQYRYWNIEQFVQDTWKITPRLTLDYGLARQLVSTAVRFFAAGVHFPARAIGSVARLPGSTSPPINPGNTSARSPMTRRRTLILPSFDIGLEVPGTGNPFQGICQAPTCPAGKYLFQRSRHRNGVRVSASPGMSPASRTLCSAPAAVSTMTASRATAFSTPSPIRRRPSRPTLNQNWCRPSIPKNILLGPPSLDCSGSRLGRSRPLINISSAFRPACPGT